MKRLMVYGVLALVLGLTGCRKEKTPEVSVRTLGTAFQAELTARPRPHCVRTGLIGFFDDGATWLVRSASATYDEQVATPSFVKELTVLRDKGWLRIEDRIIPDVGESWRISFTPEARTRFGITHNLPIRKAEVQQMCFGPDKLKTLSQPGPVELINGVYRTTITYGLIPVSVPEWATDSALGDLVWQVQPEAPVTGVARLYLDKATRTWQVDRTSAR